MDSSTVTALVVLFVFVAFIVGLIVLGIYASRKAEEKARAVIQQVLDPGEMLIGVTRGNTKGPSGTTVFLFGWLGAAIARAGGKELYAGLTNRRMILTPVKQSVGDQSVQIIPREDINGLEVQGGMYGSSTMTTHTKNGDVVLHISTSQGWFRKAMALKKAFYGM
jgi:hypothetical protein